MKRTSIALKAAAVFAGFGLSWILVTDFAAGYFVADLPGLLASQLLKGVVFILLASALLYRFLSGQLWRQELELARKEQRSRKLELIAELGREALAGQDLSQTLKTAVKQARSIMGFDVAVVLQPAASDNERSLRPRAVAGMRCDELPALRLDLQPGVDAVSYPLGDGHDLQLVLAGAEERLFPAALISEIRTPRGHFGYLALFSESEREIGDSERVTANSLARVLGLAVARHEADEQTRLREEQQRALVRLGNDGLRSHDLKALFEQAVLIVSEQLQVEFTEVLELQPDGDRLRLIAGMGWREGLVGSATVPALDDSQAGYTLTVDEPVVVTDLSQETRFQGPPLLTEHAVVSGMSVVISGADGPFGVFGAHTQARRDFSQDDVAFLQSLANILSAVIQRVRSEERRQFQAQLLDSVGEAVIATDAQGIVQYWNPGAERIYGWTAQEALGRDIEDLTVAEVSQDQAEEIMQAVSNGDVWTGEFLVRTKEGDTFPAQVTDTPFYDREGNLAGIVGVSRDLRELRQIEQALADSEALHRLVLSNISDAVFITDDEGEFTFICVNTEFIFGYGSDEVEKMGNIQELFNGTLLVSTEELDREGHVANLELEIRDREYDPHDLLVNVRRVAINGGTRLYTCRDVTDRKAAERALAESEARYRSLTEDVLETSPVGTFILDSDYKVVWINEALEEFFGLKREQVLGLDKRTLVEDRIQHVMQQSAEFRERVLASYQNNQDIESFECHVLPAGDRSERWLLHWSKPIEAGLYAGGRMEHYTDISDRKRFEQELKRSLERFQLITRATPGGLWDYHITEDWTWRSPSYAESFGYEPEEMETDFAYWADRVHPDDRDRVVGSLLRWIEGGEENWSEEYCFRRGDGSYAWIYDRGFGLFDEHGKMYRAVGSMLDISDRKRAEQELRRHATRQERLRRLDVSLLSLDHEAEMAQTALQALEGLVDFDCALVVTLDDELDSGTFAAVLGECGPEIHAGRSFELKGSGLNPEQFAAQLVQVDVGEMGDADLWLTSQAGQAGISKVLSVQMVAHGHAVGTLALGRTVRRDFTNFERESVQAVAGALAMGLRGARALETERRRAEELESLRRASLEISSQVELRPMLETVCEEAMRLLPGLDCNIFLYDGERLSFGSAIYQDGRAEEPYAQPRRDGLTYTVARSGQAIVVEDTGTHPLFGDDYPDWEGAIIGLPLKFRGDVVGVMNLAFDAPRQFRSGELEMIERLGEMAAIAISNARLFHLEQQQRSELQALLGISQELIGEADLDDILQTIVDSVTATLPAATGSSLWLVDPDLERLAPMAWSGYDDEVMETMVSPTDSSMAIRVFKREQAIMVEDTQRSPHYHDFGSSQVDAIKSSYGVPVMAAGASIGALFADNVHRTEAFTEQDGSLLESLAAMAGTAIERARLFERLRESREQLAHLSRQLVEAQEAEKRSLARELHDEVGQILTGLKLTLEMIETDERSEAPIRQAVELTSDLLGRVRDLSLDLRPSMLDDLGLQPALEWLVQRITTQSGVPIQLQYGFDEQQRFSQELETACYRIVQESLTNVVRHADADSAEVRVKPENGVLRLEIRDNGRGFDPDWTITSPGHSGISGMKERVAMLDGMFEVHSERGCGSVVIAELPLTE